MNKIYHKVKKPVNELLSLVSVKIDNLWIKDYNSSTKMPEREQGNFASKLSEKIKPFGRRIAYPLATSVLAVAASLANSSAEGENLGDVNCDGRVNSVDASLVLQKDAGLVDELACEEAGDVNTDNQLNAVDAALILQYDARLIDKFPEAIKLIETIDVGIPGINIERYNSKIKDITSSAIEYQQPIKDMFAEDSYSWPEFRQNHLFMMAAKPSVLFFDFNRGDIYYNGNNGKFYTDLKKGDDEISPETALTLWYDSISADGKILYRRFVPSPRENPRITRDEYFLIDTETSTKIVIKNLREKPLVPMSRLPGFDNPLTAPDFEVKLVEDGSKLLVSFFEEPDRGSYLIDLGNWDAQPLDIDNRVTYLLVDNSLGALLHGDDNLLGPNRRLVPNHDGSLIYAPYADLLSDSFDNQGAIIDTKSGGKELLSWPFNGISDTPHITSPDFNFIAQKVQVGGPYVHSPGAWGTAISTPEGFFLIDGLDRNVTPMRIYDNGNIFVIIGGEEALLALSGNTYEVIATESGEPVELDITKG